MTITGPEGRGAGGWGASDDGGVRITVISGLKEAFCVCVCGDYVQTTSTYCDLQNAYVGIF